MRVLDEMKETNAAMVPTLYRIEKKHRETPDTFTLEMTPAEGGAAPPFAPGQFNMLYLFGKGEVPVSISGGVDGGRPLTHTIRAVGTVTRSICDLKVGYTVGVRGPYGTSWPVADAEGRDVLIVAGGIGLAPLRSVIYHVLARREKYNRVTLLYGSRSPDEVLYRGELEKWRSRFDFHGYVTVDSARPDWRGHVGVVTRLIPSASFDPANTVAMVCGPEIMLRLTARDLADRGISLDNIYVSMERNMKCAMGFCGHCQFGSEFVCKDGPVFPYRRIERILNIREI